MARLRASGVDGIMLGRATLGNPWLIAQIADLMEGREMRAMPPAGDRLRYCIVHYRAMVEEWGEARAVPQMRKHVALYLKGIPGAAVLRERIMRIDSADAAIAVIEETIARVEASPMAAA
jgi:tRNA-dihydrouridine synthase